MNGSKCPWSPNAICSTELFSDPKGVFIIGSNDEDRKEYIETIKEVVREFDLEPYFAKDLNTYNGKQAFCSNICGQIRKARMIIADLSGPYKLICDDCKTKNYIPSVNVYWEYGYAAALEKDPILICDEEQILPFDIADKNVDDYNKKSLKDILRPLIKQKLDEPMENNIGVGIAKVQKESVYNAQRLFNIIKDYLDKIEITFSKPRGGVIDYFFDLKENDNPDIKNRLLTKLRDLLLTFKNDLKYFGSNETIPLSFCLRKYTIANRYISCPSDIREDAKELKQMFIEDLKNYCKKFFNIEIK